MRPSRWRAPRPNSLTAPPGAQRQARPAREAACGQAESESEGDGKCQDKAEPHGRQGRCTEDCEALGQPLASDHALPRTDALDQFCSWLVAIAPAPLVDPSVAPKVDPVLTATVTAPTQQSQPVHVIVYGRGAQSALGAAGASGMQDLSLIEAFSGVIDASQLNAVAGDEDVSFVTIDRPVTTTGSTTLSSASTVTLYPKVDGVDAAWSKGLTGTGLGIAIVDSGAAQVADLGGRLTTVTGSANINSSSDEVATGRSSRPSPRARAPTAATSASPRTRTSMASRPRARTACIRATSSAGSRGC